MSTSTGYHPNTIVREQPTSTGQVQCFQEGCIQRFESGAATRRAIATHTSASTAITVLNGHKRIASTIANTFHLRVPEPGDNLTIHIYGTTFAQTICASSAKGVRYCSTSGAGSTNSKKFAVVITPTTKSKWGGTAVTLTALSTKQWSVMAVMHSTVAALGGVKFTSAT